MKRYRLSTKPPESRSPIYDTSDDPKPICKKVFARSSLVNLRKVSELISAEPGTDYIHFFGDNNKYIGHCLIDVLRNRKPHGAIFIVDFLRYSNYWYGHSLRRFYTSQSHMTYEFSQGMVFQEASGCFRTESELLEDDILWRLNDLYDFMAANDLKSIGQQKRNYLLNRMDDIVNQLINSATSDY